MVAAIIIIAVLAVGGWFVVQQVRSQETTHVANPATTSTRQSQAKATAKQNEATEHHGNSPDCPDTDCIAMLVNGDLLFHEGLWNNFASANTAATDGTAFDFTSLFEPMRKYIDASDIAVCEFETPIAQRGGPYTGYPVFNIPPEGRRCRQERRLSCACTHASNHSWDQGADGISRLWDTLRPTASRRPALTRPKRIPPSRSSSTRRPVAANSA